MNSEKEEMEREKDRKTGHEDVELGRTKEWD